MKAPLVQCKTLKILDCVQKERKKKKEEIEGRGGRKIFPPKMWKSSKFGILFSSLLFMHTQSFKYMLSACPLIFLLYKNKNPT